MLLSRKRWSWSPEHLPSGVRRRRGWSWGGHGWKQRDEDRRCWSQDSPSVHVSDDSCEERPCCRFRRIGIPQNSFQILEEDQGWMGGNDPAVNAFCPEMSPKWHVDVADLDDVVAQRHVDVVGPHDCEQTYKISNKKIGESHFIEAIEPLLTWRIQFCIDKTHKGIPRHVCLRGVGSLDPDATADPSSTSGRGTGIRRSIPLGLKEKQKKKRTPKIYSMKNK